MNLSWVRKDPTFLPYKGILARQKNVFWNSHCLKSNDRRIKRRSHIYTSMQGAWKHMSLFCAVRGWHRVHPALLLHYSVGRVSMSHRGSFLIWDSSKRKRQSQDYRRSSILCTRPPVRAEEKKGRKVEELSHMLLLMKVTKNG